MNKYLKLLLFGLLIWGLPFITSMLVWDTATSAPSISLPWFYALMAAVGALGFALAAYHYFKNIPVNSQKEGWTAGIIWYLELSLLDLIFLVLLFKMPLADYYHLLLTYVNVLILSVAVGAVNFVKK